MVIGMAKAKDVNEDIGDIDAKIRSLQIKKEKILAVAKKKREALVEAKYNQVMKFIGSQNISMYKDDLEDFQHDLRLFFERNGTVEASYEKFLLADKFEGRILEQKARVERETFILHVLKDTAKDVESGWVAFREKQDKKAKVAKTDYKTMLKLGAICVSS